MVIPVVLLLIMGVVFFTISSVSDDNTGDINEEMSATEEMDEEEDTGETEESSEDGTLPQSPVSDCLPSAVKYSFEAEYGESKPIDLSVLPRSEEAPGEINNHLQFVRQYLFALPGYYNNQNNEALEF